MSSINTLKITVTLADKTEQYLRSDVADLEPEEIQSLATSMLDALLAEQGLIKSKGLSGREGAIK